MLSNSGLKSKKCSHPPARECLERRKKKGEEGMDE